MNILLIGFNRSNLLKKQLNFLNNVEYVSSVTLVIDGPRVGNANDAAQQSDLKAWLETFCPNYELKIIFEKTNRGCKRGVEFAIDHFFERHSDGVILEDDCQVDQQFLELYRQYKNILCQDKVFMITACSFIENAVSDLMFFSRYPHIWGWSTTSKNWKSYRESKPNRSVRHLIKIFSKNTFLENAYFVPKWLQAWGGKIDTWDYDLSYYMLSNDMRCLVPGQNLVRNVGIDNSGAHGLEPSDDLTNKQTGLKLNLSRLTISPNGKEYDYSILRRRLFNKLRKLFS